MNITPTRRITKSYRSITGKKPSKKTGNSHQFESSLERDYITLLEFDDEVDDYVEQPITIHYLYGGKERIYTPDFLIIYKPTANRRTLLSEIKYKSDLLANGDDYNPKFNAAKKFADKNGYQFKVITEEDIRTEIWQNAVFLNRYAFGKIDENDSTILKTTLLALKESTPDRLIEVCGAKEKQRGELLYTLWQLVAKKEISCNLNIPLSMQSKIWLLK